MHHTTKGTSSAAVCGPPHYTWQEGALPCMQRCVWWPWQQSVMATSYLMLTSHLGISPVSLDTLLHFRALPSAGCRGGMNSTAHRAICDEPVTIWQAQSSTVACVLTVCCCMHRHLLHAFHTNVLRFFGLYRPEAVHISIPSRMSPLLTQCTYLITVVSSPYAHSQARLATT